MRKSIYLLPFIFILNLLQIGQGFAQTFTLEEQSQIDSLNEVINNSNSKDTSKVMAHLTILNYYYLSNCDTAILMSQKAMELAESINFPKGKAESYGWLAYLLQEKGDVIKAIKLHEKSALIQKQLGNKHGMAISYNNIGSIYSDQGDIPLALKYYHQSLKMYEAGTDEKGTAIILNNIGGIYGSQNDSPKALEYYGKSLKIHEKIEDKEGIARSLNNMGLEYDYLGDSAKALDNFNRALKIQEEIGNKKGIAYALNNIGLIYDHQGAISQALEFYHKALKVHEEIENKSGITLALSNIGGVILDNGNAEEAEVYADRCLVVALETGFPEDVESASILLSEIYEQQNRGQEALEMYKLYITMRDSVNNEATNRAMAQQQAKYEYEKQKTIDDAHNDNLLALKHEEKEKQKLISYAAAGGLVLVILFLIFVFNRLKATRKQKGIIQSQKETVEIAHDQLEEKNREITDSINYAKRIQSAILPPLKVVKEYLQESFILYKPKDIVAGDFYWLEQQAGKILFAAADCTGHGVPGAMVSVVCNNALNRSVREHGLLDPGAILDQTRKIVIQEFEKSDEEVMDGMDIALCSLDGNRLEYAGANNPIWIIRKQKVKASELPYSDKTSVKYDEVSGYSIIEVKADKQPIGKFDQQEPYTTHVLELQKGDSLYIFSDGYIDQFGGERGKKLKSKAFKNLLLSVQHLSMEEQQTSLALTFEDWKGDIEQLDDVCVIGVRV